MSNAVSEILKRFGGQSVVARILDVTPSAVGNWPSRGIPTRFFFDLIRAARERGISLTEDDLLSTTSRKSGTSRIAPSQDPPAKH